MENPCNHSKVIESPNKIISNCRDCGVLLFTDKHIYGIKPSKYNYKVDINPLKLFDNLNFSLEQSLKINDNTSYLKKRASIIQTLRYINKKLKFRTQTLFLALCYLDEIMLNVETEICPELVGLSCLLLAGKYDENDPIFPYLSSLSMVYPKHIFLEDEINNTEIFIIKSLKYKLDCYSSFNFLQFFSLNGFLFTDDFIQENNYTQKVYNSDNIDKIYEKSFEILNQLLEEEISIGIPSIYIALSVITLTRNLFKLNDIYPKHFEDCYQVRFNHLSSYYEQIKKWYCQMNGIVLDNEKPKMPKLRERLNTINFNLDLTKLLNTERKPEIEEGEKSNTPDKNYSTKANSNISSEQKNSNKKTNFLYKYMIIKEPKQSSNSDIKISIIAKIRNSLNNKKEQDKSDSKEIPIVQKNIRNLRKSMLGSNFMYSTDQEINKNKGQIAFPLKLKVCDSKFKNFRKDNSKEISIYCSVPNEQKEVIKVNIIKKLDYSNIGKLSTKTSNNSSYITKKNSSFNEAPLMRKFVNKPSTNFKESIGDSTKFLL